MSKAVKALAASRHTSEPHSGSDIDQHLQGRVAKARAALLAERSDVEAAIDKANQRAEAIPPMVEAIVRPSTESLLYRTRSRLVALTGLRRKACLEKANFQQDHGLSREPRKPSVLLNVCLLGMMMGVEAFVNTGFFANAYMVATPAQGFLVSCLIAATNIMVSACGGFFIGRYLGYGKSALDPDLYRAVRQRAKLGLGVFLLVVTLFHLVVGLVRSQESLSLVEHSFTAYLGILASPESVFLILVGICLSAIAFVKGVSAFSDPYPGYSTVQSAIDDLDDQIETLREDSADDIENLYSERLEEQESAHKTRHKAIETFNRARDKAHSTKRALVQSVRSAEDQLSQQGAALYAKRQRIAGGTLPPFDVSPYHFAEVLEGLVLPTYHAPDNAVRGDPLAHAKERDLSALNALFQLTSEQAPQIPSMDKTAKANHA